jgi:hypothetical protein
MRRQLQRQLVLELECGERIRPEVSSPEALLQALADLLLEALRKQGNQKNATGGSDESEDHA